MMNHYYPLQLSQLLIAVTAVSLLPSATGCLGGSFTSGATAYQAVTQLHLGIQLRLAYGDGLDVGVSTCRASKTTVINRSVSC